MPLRSAIVFYSTLACLALGSLAWARPVEDAIAEITGTESTDPRGCMLMVVCVSLLVVMATTLMVVTLTYKKKKDPKN